MEITHGHLDIGVTEEFLNCRKRDTLLDEMSGEGMTEEVGVSFFDRLTSLKSEEFSEPLWSQRQAAIGAFQDGETFWMATLGPFIIEVIKERLSDGRRDGENAMFVPFTPDADLIVDEIDVLGFERQHLAGAEATEDHEIEDGEVAVFAESGHKFSDLGEGERHDDYRRHLDP